MARLVITITKTKSSPKSRPHFRIQIYNISAIRQNKTIQLDVPEGKVTVKKEYLDVGVVRKKVVEVKKEKVYKYVQIEGLKGVAKKVVEVKTVKKEIEIRKAVKLADILCNKYELVRLIVFILSNAKNVTPQLFKSQKLSRNDITIPYSFMVSISDAYLKYFRKKNLVKILRGLSNGYFRLHLDNFRKSITPEKAFTIGIIDLLS